MGALQSKDEGQSKSEEIETVIYGPMTIWHPDILDITCGFLDKPAVQALRLVNREICHGTNPWLFRTLAVRLRRRSLDRLDWVANNQRFARGVRAIVWETAHYHDDEPPFDERLFDSVLREGHIFTSRPLAQIRLGLSDDQEKQRRQKQHVLARYKALAAEEQDLYDRDALCDHDLKDRLAHAFAQLKGLTSVDFIAWNRPLTKDGDVYERNTFGSPDYEPPPLKAIAKCRPPKYSFHHQSGIMFALILALQAAERKLLHFGTLNAQAETCRRITNEDTLQAPFMAFSFEQIARPGMDDIAQTLSGLRSLRLRFYAFPVWMQGIVTIDGRMQFFMSHLTALRDLEIKLDTPNIDREIHGSAQLVIVSLSQMLGDTVYPHLHRIALHGFWLEHDELCNFLLAHRASLEDVTLTEMHLDETRLAPRGPADVGIVDTSGPPPKRVDIMHQWDVVGQACQQLAKLKALRVSGCKRGANEQGMSETGCLRVVEDGMNGRQNKREASMVEDQDWDEEWAAYQIAKAA